MSDSVAEQHPEPVVEVEQVGGEAGGGEAQREPHGVLEVHRARGEVGGQPAPPQQRGRHVEVPGRRRRGGRVGRGARARPYGEDQPEGGVADRGGEPADPHHRRQLVAGEPGSHPLDAALEVLRDARGQRPALRGLPGAAQRGGAPGERVAGRGEHGARRGPRGGVAKVGQQVREQPGAHQHRAQLGRGVGQRPVAAARAGRPDRRGQAAGAQRLHRGFGRLPRTVGGQAGDVVGDGVDGVGEPLRNGSGVPAGHSSRSATATSPMPIVSPMSRWGREAGS